MQLRWSDTGTRGDDYDARFEARAAEGHDVHGEADFVARFSPRSVLDAGCGTGLHLLERFSTWDGLRWETDADYAVSVYRRL